MDRPEMPLDIKEAKQRRELAIRNEMFRSVRIKVLAELFSAGPIAEIDMALGVDRRAILKSILEELSGTLDQYQSEYIENTD